MSISCDGPHSCSVGSPRGLQLGWGKLGKTLTGQYPFFWMDPAEVGRLSVVLGYVSGFEGMGTAGESFVRRLLL
ncbi:hypothetical protein VTK26DRAFT_1979 [Humicola hyalothermophila]